MKKTGQLTYEKRVKLQAYLEDDIPIAAICTKLGVTKQTIYREIQRNSKIKPAKIVCKTNKTVRCKFRATCPYTYDPIRKSHFSCFEKCEKYEEEVCEIIKKAPFICNKCPKRGTCSFVGRYYYVDNHNQLEHKESCI